MEQSGAALFGKIGYLSADERELVYRAARMAEEWHRGQIRDSGEPYVTHPVAVAMYLAGLEASADTLVAALLHDVVEDNRATAEDVERQFGLHVAHLVDGVTKLSKVHYEGRRDERQLASLRKLLLTANDDLRVILIKLADRWHNVETIGNLQASKRARVAQETLDIYVPFARLMGLWDLKTRFEQICFPIAQPEEAARWHEAITELRLKLRDERAALVKELNEETSDDVRAVLQEMTDYEIFRKLQGNIHRLDDPQHIDTVSVTIMGQEVDPIRCYEVLGEIHQRYPVLTGAFRDFISAPKPNGYRGLHSVVFLSRAHTVRIRIQTQSMHDYASNRKISQWLRDDTNDLYQALHSLHRAEFDQSTYLRDLDQTVLQERINVFTPSGEILTLPRDATGVDFAFELNPDHLSYLIGVRINGELREATAILHEGDTVDVELSRDGGGELRTMWADRVRSVDARRGLLRTLGAAPVDQRENEGRMLLQNECMKRRLPVWVLFHLASVQEELSRRLKRPDFHQVLVDLGSGLLSASFAANEYRQLLSTPPLWSVRLLRWIGLLPRSRVLDQDAKVLHIEVYAQDRKGMIYDITRCFAEQDINIAQFGVYAVPPHDALYKISLEAKNFDAFSNLYDALLQVPGVRKILRKK